MRFHRLTTADLVKAIGIGIATALLLSAVMVPALRFGISPLPKPLGLAFAETLLGRSLPLPVGLLFHIAYVTFWAAVYVALFRHALTFAMPSCSGCSCGCSCWSCSFRWSDGASWAWRSGRS